MNYIPSIELNAAGNLDFEKAVTIGAPTPSFQQKTFRNQSSNNTSLHNIDAFQDSQLPLDNQKQHLKPSTFANKTLSTLNKIEFVGTFDDLNVMPPQLPSSAYLSQKIPTDPERSPSSSQENKESLAHDPQDQTDIIINVEDANPAMDQNLVSNDHQTENVVEFENNERGEKAKNVISQALEVYFILTVTYGLSLLSLHERIPYVTLLWFLLAICLFQTIRTLIQSIKAEEPNIKSEKVFKVLDWIAFSVLAVLALGKNSFEQIMLWPAVVPGIMSTVIYWIFAAQNDFFIRKGGMVFIKLVFWSQILLIALKLDNVVTTWLYVFVLIYYILVFFMSISIGIFILTLAYLWQNFRTINSNHTALGLLWDFFNTLFSWIWGFIILNLTDKLQEGESSLLNTFLLIGIIHSAVLGLYTLLFKTSLAEYMQTALENEGEEEDEPNANPIKSTFQVVKGHIPYLVRVSPTYFIMSSEKGKAKDSKQQNQQLKHQIFDAKMHKHQIKLESSNKQLEILGKIMPQSVKETHKKTKSYAFTHRGPNLIPAVAALKNRNIEESDDNPDFLPNLCYSRDDADIIKDLPGAKNLNESVADADEKQCIVCFSSPQNAVFMNCGHGGVCYECALESWKRDNGCLLCRKPIDEVLKVALFPGIDVVKVLEGTKKSVILDS